MTDQMLKDAFERLADRAEPVDGLAERALRRADRRRAIGISGVVLGAAAAVTVPMVFLGGGSSVGPGPATAPALRRGLPANTPAELEIVRACMRNGSPTGPMGDAQPRLGQLSDFRLLTSTQVNGETVATVGSTRGFVLCVRGKEGNTMPPWLHPWVGGGNQGLRTFAGEGRVDAIDYQLRTGKGGIGTSTSGLHHLITGRVKPGVVRVVINWDRGRKVEGAVRNGFFIARVDSTLIKNTNPGKQMAKFTGASETVWEPRDERILSVEGFDSAGRSSIFIKTSKKGVQLFDSADCFSALLKAQINFLCSAGSPPLTPR